MDTIIDDVRAAGTIIRKRLEHGEHSQPPLSLLEREIAFVSAQLERASGFRRDHLEQNHHQRFYTYNELEHCWHYHIDRRNMLVEKLRQIDEERWRILLLHERDIVRLEERLFSLLNQLSIMS